MKLDKLLEIIIDQNLIWEQVENQPCIHAYFTDYYVMLCLYLDKVSINVDDLEKCIDDIIDVEISLNEPLFDEISKIYKNALSRAVVVEA